jgi:hypothetical protein
MTNREEGDGRKLPLPFPFSQTQRRRRRELAAVAFFAVTIAQKKTRGGGR